MENIFIILLGLSMVYLASTSRLLAHINMLAGQGWLLFLICLTGGDLLADGMPKLWSLLFIIFETLVVKAFVIPMFLRKIVKKTHSHRDTDANIPHFVCRIFNCKYCNTRI